MYIKKVEVELFNGDKRFFDSITIAGKRFNVTSSCIYKWSKDKVPKGIYLSKERVKKIIIIKAEKKVRTNKIKKIKPIKQKIIKEVNGKPIKTNTNYLVLKDGRIWSIRSQKYLSYQTKSGNYLRVSIDGKTKYVHRLVAESYIPNYYNLPHVNHIDNNKQNNHYTNLEWVTHQQNIEHARKIKGNWSKNNFKKLNKETKIQNIYTNEILTFKSRKDVERYFGYSNGAVLWAIKHKSLLNKHWKIIE